MTKRIFFDTEFTGLHKDTSLISIGLVSECGYRFYAELLDYDVKQVNDWIQTNVLDNTLYLSKNSNPQELSLFDNCIVVCNTKNHVRDELLDWLESFDSDIEFVTDVGHYDMVLLIDLLADSALQLPNNISPTYIDINQSIQEFLTSSYGFNVTIHTAFHMNREELLTEVFGVNIPKVCKHNALYDALIIKELYEQLKGEDEDEKQH